MAGLVYGGKIVPDFAGQTENETKSAVLATKAWICLLIQGGGAFSTPAIRHPAVGKASSLKKKQWLISKGPFRSGCGSSFSRGCASA